MYENNTQEAKATLVWAMSPSEEQVLLLRCNASSSDNRAVVFGFSNDYAIIVANVYVNSQRPARGVAADEKNFERR